MEGQGWLRGARPWLLAGAGLLVVLVGVELKPRSVEATVHHRRSNDAPYWVGRLEAPAFVDGSFFRQVLENSYASPPLPFPDRTPPFRVTLRLQLVAPTDGIYQFEVDTEWSTALDVNGERVLGSHPFRPGTGRAGEVELAAGTHELVVLSQPMDEIEAPLRLLWRVPGGPLRPVTAENLFDPRRPRSHALGASVSTWLVGVGALGLGLGILSWVVGVSGAGGRREAVAATVLLASFSFVVWGTHSNTYPRMNGDEVHNAWAGFNLIHEGTPRTWSYLPGYVKTFTPWFSYEYPLVEGAYDHPPLLPILIGAEATLLGAATMWDATLPRIRPLMILIGVASVVLLFFLARELAGFQVAFLAATILATSPLTVYNGRLAKEDCLVQLLLLLGIFLYLRNRDRRSTAMDWTVGVIGGLAAVTKVMGLAVGIGIALASIAESPREWGRPARILTMTFLIGSLYPIFGLMMDADTYLRVMGHLSSTYPLESLVDKFSILPRLILDPRISANTPLIDGWILLGWLSLYRLLKEPAVTVPFVSYLLVLVATVLSSSVWGFYIAPVLPFLALSAALQVKHTLKHQEFVAIFLFIGLFFLPSAAHLSGLATLGGFRGVLLMSCIPLLPPLMSLPSDHTISRINRVVLTAMLLIAVFANASEILSRF